jgi:RNA polymerase sigma factor (sigma-70 family)
MTPPEPQTTILAPLLDAVRNGSPPARAAAREELVRVARQRLERMAHAMLGRDRLRRWTETDDVFQGFVPELLQSLERVEVTTAGHFFRLAGRHIQRELTRLARHFFGPEGLAAHHASDPGLARGLPAQDQEDPRQRPERWLPFWEAVAKLPEREADIFNMKYQQLTEEEIADELGISTRAVRRAWRSACKQISELLGGEFPML